jgi:hypothetical protein
MIDGIIKNIGFSVSSVGESDVFDKTPFLQRALVDSSKTASARDAADGLTSAESLATSKSFAENAKNSKIMEAALEGRNPGRQSALYS